MSVKDRMSVKLKYGWQNKSCVFVHRVCVSGVGKETVVLLSPEQAALRLSKFPLTNNNSPQVCNEASRRTETRPTQYEGV